MGGPSEADRVIRHKQKWSTGLPPIRPNTTGWVKLMVAREQQLRRLTKDVQQRWDGFMDLMQSSRIVPNFTRSGFEKRRTLPMVHEKLSSRLLGGLAAAADEQLGISGLLITPQTKFVPLTPNEEEVILKQLQPMHEEWGGVDLVLPPGTYGMVSGELAIIDLDVSGLRLVAAGPGVTLAAGVRVRGARDVVLEGVTVDCRGGQALTVLDGAHVVVVDSVLMGRARVVHVDDGALELHGSRLAPTADQPAHGSSAQLLGGALLVGRNSAMIGGSLFIGQGGAEVRLDRCVLDSGDRPLAQGQGGGRLLARESLFLSRGAGFMAMDEIVLSAVVVDTAFQPFGRGETEVRVGPDLFALTGSQAGAARVERLGVEPIPMALAPIGGGR